MTNEPILPGHPHLSDELNTQIQQSAIEGGARLSDLKTGRALIFTTKNSTYRVVRDGDGFSMSGNSTFCPTPTRVVIAGSTWGGSMIKTGFIGRGMHVEFYLKGGAFDHVRITTTEVQDIQEVEA